MKNEINFKPEQKEIIDSQGKNLIVSASAGSGKTTVMISKIANLIINKRVPIRSILVLTYTQNAASEMKQKLLNELKKHAEQYEFLEDEIENIDSSDISTIHSFCQKLIKKNFYLFPSLSPNFSILSNEQRAILRVNAMKTTLEKFKKENQEAYLDLIKIYDRNRSDSKLTELIFAIDNFLDSYLNVEEFRMKTAFYLYDHPEKAFEILNEKLCDKVESMKQKFSLFSEKSQNLGLFSCLALSNDVLANLKQIKKENDFMHNVNLVQNMTFARKKNEPDNPEFLEEIVMARETVKQLKDDMKKKNYSESLKGSFDANRNILKVLLRLQQSFSEEYAFLKNQIGSLDFPDLERYAIRLTSEQSVQKSLQEKYEYIFIDEFQDANEVQEKLISNIARQNNRFMVGDVKQSIYGFRRSNPQIFLDTEKKYETDKNSESKVLNLNFRSDENILEFVNIVFSSIMTFETAQIDYKNNAKFKPFKKMPKTQLPRVAINICLKEKAQKEQMGEKVFSILEQEMQEDEESSAAEQEAYLVANDILKLKNHYLFDGEKKRPVNFSDITILVRKRGKYFDQFCSALTSYGVPIYANSSKSIFEQTDVLKLLHLLQLTQNIYDDYSLTAVMLSLIGNFSYDDLAKVKLAYQSEPYFYNCVFNYAKDKSDDLSAKLQAFFKQIDWFTSSCKMKGVYLSLEELMRQSEYKIKTYAFSDGAARVQTIEKFVNIFKNSEFNFNIQAFLAFAKEENKEIKTPNYTDGELDCVNITTIHASKGLEYPIVFVVQAGADFTKTPQKAEIKLHDKLGIGLKFYDTEEFKKETSFVFEAIDETIKEEEFAEIQRLLYVGLTRAKEYLYIYGSTNNKQYSHFEKKHEIIFSKTYLDLIMNSFSSEDIQKIAGSKQTEISKDNVSFTVEFFDKQAQKGEEKEQTILFSKGDEALKNKLLTSFDFSYPNQEVFSVALKNSVSSLLQADDYASQNHAPSKFLLSEHLSGEDEKAILGTLYHKMLQLANFETYTQETLMELKNALAKEEEIAKEIDIQKVDSVIKIVKKLKQGQPLQKEKKFIMKVPYASVTQSNLQEEILVQGVIDLFSFGKRNILIDYKLSSLNSDEKLVAKYQKQISLYKKALLLGCEKQNVECFIIDINRAKAIEIKC